MATNNKALVNSILKNTKQIADFSKVLSFNNYFSPELARSGITQQTERFFAPQVDTAIQGVRQDYIRRGLARSGMRGRAEQGTLADYADQLQSMNEQLYGTRESEARTDYSDLQKQYEKAPTSYKGPKGTTSQGYQVETPQMYQTTQDIYGGAGTQGAGGFSYLQALRDYQKKQSPDFYKKYYGN